ncbi:PHA/PHB synthase family protein [Halomonas chromatireducens]|uniref:Poly-beta-hydroxybutyrate polymerase n=1 Tax=Halomonas chromatireducens TaxID=507626 RepID=A0A0X8HC38_9GAMM|nr:alpha/beta fold hydrolase [Halomonas chromatireducens]AMC99896.1 Poly-beta-hydroxybutyrate polymerase [Halomonas chromatireducens]
MHQDNRTKSRSSEKALSAPSPSVAERPNPGYYATHALDRAFKANLARMTAGVTPAGLTSVYFEWLTHLALSPGKQVELSEKALRKSLRLGQYVNRWMQDPATPPCIEPMSQDRRFDDEAWQQWPYNLFYQSFLLTQQWWHNATTGVEGLPPQREYVVNFVTRQLLDRWSPSNIPWLNPEVIATTLQSGGKNLMDGWQNVIEDWERNVSGKPPVGAERFRVGEELAVTPGKVVYRNHLIELIQYIPTTEQVHAEPVLIVPAWIMKYYILDLTPGKSVVEYLVDQGYTVFMISWRNPGSEDRDLGLEDYRRLGPMAALDVVTEITGQPRVHGVGYCLGGTLLSIAAAAMARDDDKRLATLTTLATQVDFTEAGELMLFIGESQVSYLENMMWDQGYLDGYQMAGAFQILRSNDLVWSRMVHSYLLGQHQPMNELMAWNTDITRLPYRMHSEYLRQLFLNNDLASGRYQVEHRPVAIQDIRAPIFAVGTTSDHVAPWQSVYKVHLLTDADEVTFLLTSGGHNAGIVSEPDHPRRHFQMRTQHQGEPYVDPLNWRETTPEQEGSWWPAWREWLVAHSSGKTAPPQMGSERFPPLEDAPGSYVRQP